MFLVGRVPFPGDDLRRPELQQAFEGKAVHFGIAQKMVFPVAFFAAMQVVRVGMPMLISFGFFAPVPF